MAIRIKDRTSGEYHDVPEDTPALKNQGNLHDGGLTFNGPTHPDAIALDFFEVGETCLVPDDIDDGDGGWMWWVSKIVAKGITA